MSIIVSRRIPYPLEGAESCGANQKWDPNYVFNGIKGQCVPSSQPLVQMASSGTNWGAIANTFTSLFSSPKPAAPTAMPTAYAPAAPAGMSTNTMIAIGLGAVGLIAVLMVATRK